MCPTISSTRAACCFRIVQNNNWKIFLENQLDAVHASITHISAAKAATDTEKEIKEETGEDAPYFYKYISSLSTPLPRWATLETRAYPYGHCLLGGYLGLRPTDPDSVFYENIMREKYGAEKAEEILSRGPSHSDLSVPLRSARVSAIARYPAARTGQNID
jgi:phenylpropionate dioxygenase-like ring-hydroxylating dioxygenase large terminal subunit